MSYSPQHRSGDGAVPVRPDVFGQNSSFAPFIAAYLPLSQRPSHPCFPASGYLWEGGEELGEEAFPIPPTPGELGLVYDLVPHMIENI